MTGAVVNGAVRTRAPVAVAAGVQALGAAVVRLLLSGVAVSAGRGTVGSSPTISPLAVGQKRRW